MMSVFAFSLLFGGGADASTIEERLSAWRDSLTLWIANPYKTSGADYLDSLQELGKHLRIDPLSSEERVGIFLLQRDWSKVLEHAEYPSYLHADINECNDSLGRLIHNNLVRLGSDLENEIQKSKLNRAGKAILLWHLYEQTGRQFEKREIAEDSYHQNLDVGETMKSPFEASLIDSFISEKSAFGLYAGGGRTLFWHGKGSDIMEQGAILETGFFYDSKKWHWEFAGMRIGIQKLQRDLLAKNGDTWPVGMKMEVADFTLVGVGRNYQLGRNSKLSSVLYFGGASLGPDKMQLDSLGYKDPPGMQVSVGTAVSLTWFPWLPEYSRSTERQILGMQWRMGMRWLRPDKTSKMMEGVQTYASMNLVLGVVDGVLHKRKWPE